MYLFRGDVIGCAHELPGPGEALVGRRLRQAEISEICLIAAAHLWEVIDRGRLLAIDLLVFAVSGTLCFWALWLLRHIQMMSSTSDAEPTKLRSDTGLNPWLAWV